MTACVQILPLSRTCQLTSSSLYQKANSTSPFSFLCIHTPHFTHSHNKAAHSFKFELVLSRPVAYLITARLDLSIATPNLLLHSTMDDDAALAARLELLGNMLGERITMIARPHTPDNEVAAPLVDPENDLPQEGGRAPSQTPNESGDALPEKIVSTDSVPIPAQTFQPLNYVVQAFDCSQFHVGEPQNERFEFCPWSVIQSYPDCFIGNTNRRRVRHACRKLPGDH